MDIKSRLSNYGLWVSIFALIPLLAQAFGYKLPENYAQLINAILGILVVAGVLNNPSTINNGFLDDIIKPAPVVKEISPTNITNNMK